MIGDSQVDSERKSGDLFEDVETYVFYLCAMPIYHTGEQVESTWWADAGSIWELKFKVQTSNVQNFPARRACSNL